MSHSHSKYTNKLIAKMQIEIIQSNRGGNIALHDGYSYNQKQTTSNCIHWRCTKYYAIKCPAILKTSNNNVIDLKGCHNHETDPSECKAKIVVNHIKQRAATTTPTVAVATEITEITDEYAVQLAMPKKDNLIRTASRKRQREQKITIPNPIDRHFEIPEEFSSFLLKDSGKDDKERILIFGDPMMNELLNVSKTWLVDGTFKLSPENFYQIYTIHAELKGFSPPCLYVLLPNKTEHTYSRMIDMIQDGSNIFGPERILADFEKAVLNAFGKKFPEAAISGCYFHLTQSFNRKINEIGLKTFYENSPDFNLALRMLPALALVPASDVKGAFELVIEEITEVIDKEKFDESVTEKVEELVLYFKNSYIEGPTITKKAPFPIEIWNQFEASSEGVARTTNSVEGWHYGLQTFFTGSQPNVWLLLRNLQKDCKMQKFKYIQETSGILCSKRPRYEKVKKQMQIIQAAYNFENVLPHLRAVAKFR